MKEIRTQLTDEKLKQSIDILQDIMDVCKTCITKDIPWSRACKDKGLNPLKTRALVLRNLDKCTNFNRSLEDMDFPDTYDGYECFYRAVFEDSLINKVVLPFDYIETVTHIIKNTGLYKRESLILMRRFGIGDYEIPELLEPIANDLNLSKNRVSVIENNAIQKCRNKQRVDILKMGLMKYNLKKEQEEALIMQQMEHAKAEQEALLKKYNEQHVNHMEVIASNSYDDAVAKLFGDNLPGRLAATSIDVLGLRVRPYNALRHEHVTDLLHLLKFRSLKDLMEIPHMGWQSADEVIKSLDTYVKENFKGMTVNKLRELCFGNMED